MLQRMSVTAPQWVNPCQFNVPTSRLHSSTVCPIIIITPFFTLLRLQVSEVSAPVQVGTVATLPSPPLPLLRVASGRAE